MYIFGNSIKYNDGNMIHVKKNSQKDGTDLKVFIFTLWFLQHLIDNTMYTYAQNC